MIVVADEDADTLTSAAHGLSAGVIVYLVTDGVLPDPLVQGTRYLVDLVDENVIRLQTAGGVPVDLLDAGTGVHKLFALQDEVDVIDAGRLYEKVRDYCEAEETGVSVVFGWREPVKQINQGENRGARICVVPGDDTGKTGTYAMAKLTGRNRQAQTKLELVTFLCWGFDGTAPKDELAQYRACRVVENLALNAIRAAAVGRATPSEPKWIRKETDMAFGAELTFSVELQVPVMRRTRFAFVAGGTVAAAPSVTMAFPGGDFTSCPPS